MKTLFTHLQKVANTPPTCLLVLFAWLLMPFNVSADPIEFRQSNSTDLLGGASSITKGEVTLSAEGISHINHGAVYSVGMDDDSYVDVTLNSGYNISAMQVGVYPDCNVDAVLKVQFCSSPEYSDAAKIGDPRTSTSLDYSGYYALPHTLSTISSVPEGAKSARLYKTGTVNCGFYLVGVSVTIEDADPCSASVTVSFSKAASETGEVPANKDICTDYSSSFTIPGKNTLVYDTKHAFVGWEKGGVTYAEDDTYTITPADISAGTIAFTAVWSEVKAYDLAITDPVNNTIPLSWKIPGICDVKGGTDPIFIPNNGFNQFGVLSSTNYNNEDDYDFITANGNSPIYGQYGIGFDIPATKDLSWFSYEWKGYNSNVSLCATTCSNSQAYWDASSYPTSLNNNTNWTPQGPYTLKNAWWSDPMPSTNPEVSQIVIFANVGTATSGISFSVRNVRYGIAGRADIDHIVLVRKAGSVPANKEDGDVLLSNSTKSHFIDTDVKTPGTTYYYAVFAVYSDASVSSPVYVSHTMETVDTYTVTYDKGEGTVTGDVPTDAAEYAATNSVMIAGKNNLARVGYTFAGWNDGSTTYNPGDSYTMPAQNVIFTAVWAPIIIPTVTNLSLDGVDKTVTLSWKIPGFIDLNTAKTTPSSSFSTAYGSFTYASDATVNSDGELVVTYSAAGGGSITGFLFDVNLSNIEALYFDYAGDYTGSGWNGIFPGIYCSTNSTMYWEGGSHDLKNVDWQSKEITTFTGFWKSGTYASENISELGFFANACNDAVENGHMYIRNLRYHCTGQVDIDHIVLVRKDGSAPANPTDGDVLHYGTKSAFVDDDASKVDGHTYYYKVFSVHADGSYSAPEAVSYTIPAASLITHTRNLTVGEYGTICLPYEVQAANIVGADVFELAGWPAESNAVTLNQIPGNMAAGHPYIFQATAATSTFSYEESGYQDAQSVNGLIGSYSQEIITPNDNNYIIYNNQLYLVDVLAYVGANRAYINRTAAESAVASPAPGRRQIKLYVAGTEVATGLEQINGTCPDGKYIKDGQFFIRRDGRTYNAQGIEIK